MKSTRLLTILVVALLCACGATAEEYDFYRNLHYPAKVVPGVGRNKVEQEGGPDATGYRRRTVRWWPRKGQDVIDVPKGAPLRTWTRNKGQQDKEALGATDKQLPVFLWEATLSATNVRQCAVADRVTSHSLFFGRSLAGLCRNWTSSDAETFKAHLVGFRGFGVPTPNATFRDEILIPAAVLRLDQTFPRFRRGFRL